ncbi:hypothetical protein ASD83_00040 [Devosia sp. Root685]|uniref:hypothetical protein n=1 Tax=Devosia sp. Root685 TaxID=1736587 RepID=UPI0006FE5A41|nr:hypothetical protein [Devosia sp. Root685]KRA98977.1 hypothetical protein ASD83_00040 [Devosia sp. Root685]
MKISKFYKLVDQFPSPVVPVFKRENGDGRDYAQIVGSNGDIIGFEEAPALEDSRILAAGNYPYSDAHQGMPAQYAVAYSRTQILVNSMEVVARDIKEFIKVHRSEMKPFALLELAMFTKDFLLVEDAAERCRQNLNDISHEFSNKWIDGAPLPAEIKDKLRIGSASIYPDQLTRSGQIRFGFTGPRKMMAGITDYCTTFLHITRAQFIKSMLGPKDASRRLQRALDRSPEVIADIVSRYGVQDGRYPRDALDVSRGAIRFTVEDHAGFIQYRKHFLASVIQSPVYRDLLRIPSYSAGTEFLNFTILTCIMIEYAPGFYNYYKSITERVS